MPLVGPVSLRNPRIRVFVGLLYLGLILGGITMVYPFALMVATSFKSETDSDDHTLLPRYLHSEQALWTKYLEAKYGEFSWKWAKVVSVSTLGRVYDATRTLFHFEDVKLPDISERSFEQRTALREDWRAFRAELDRERRGYLRSHFRGRPSRFGAWEVAGEAVEDYRAFLQERFGNDTELINRTYGVKLAEGESADRIMPQPEMPWSPSWLPDLEDPQYRDWLEWRRQAPERYTDVFPTEPAFHRFIETRPQYVNAAYGGNLMGQLNAEWGTAFESLEDVPLPLEPPGNLILRELWREYAINKLSRQYLRLEPGILDHVLQFLRNERDDPTTPGMDPFTITDYNTLCGTNYESFEEISIPERIEDATGALRAAVIGVLRRPARGSPEALDHLRLETPEGLYRDHLSGLSEIGGSIDRLNRRYGTRYRSFDRIDLPVRIIDFMDLQECKGHFRGWMFFRNYRMVLRFLTTHGRALWNTVVLCCGSILFTLTINPLCAYALSRYRLPFSNQILIYLLATMAFPPSVAMIPNFLLLRNLHLLNTYWALLLPRAANGFTIFMMKGFFDTLPREVFEAAKIDGASELRMFFQILIPLCKPVFGFFALGAFTAAYSGFIWAFTICPKAEMWTMMVWLYQMTTLQPFSVQMAALVLAAIPTLLVFTVVQNVILKGIVLPTFH